MGGSDMAVRAVDQYTLDALLDQLDLGARQARTGEEVGDKWACHRKSPRHPFRAKCTVRFPSGGFDQITELPGRTRNLSRGGLALLTRRMFLMGDPVEIEIRPLGKPVMFLAGVVTFCRYAGQGHHELGIALKMAGDEPIFSDRFDEAVQKYDWLDVNEATELK